jgi:hypothetical protein
MHIGRVSVANRRRGLEKNIVGIVSFLDPYWMIFQRLGFPYYFFNGL